MWNGALGERISFYFARVFYYYWKRSLSWGFQIFLIFSKQVIRQLVYTIFITNNHASFHLWWKEKLVKHQQVSKYYMAMIVANIYIRLHFLLNYSLIYMSRLYVNCSPWKRFIVWFASCQEATATVQKMKFFIKNFCSKCDQICRKLRIWSHLLKISLMENFIFCAVCVILRSWSY